ncbi:MAG TPA: c-type cytochrome [Burkholderiales bacterium]
MRSLVSVACIVLAAGVAPAHAGNDTPVAPNSEQAASGRAIYQTYCASCHGANGEGAPAWRERDARGELPPPPHDAQGHAWRHSDAMLSRMILHGWRDPFNKTERVTMPAFTGTIAPQEVRFVIAYLKTLWTPEQRQFQREESQRQSFAPAAH